MAKEKLYQIILETESELKELEHRIQNHEDEILQAKRYLQSLYEKEDTEGMIFSPRNLESRYQGDIAKSKSQIKLLEKENQALYHKRNVVQKRIASLREIWDSLEASSTLSLSEENHIQTEKNDNSVNYEALDKEYASWIMENPNGSDDPVDMLHILQALDNDRKRIASDLHDTLVQDLVHTIHMVELCGKYMDQDSVQAKLELVSIEKYLRETIQKARNFISDLRPMIFDDLGFCETLLNAVEDLQKHTSMLIVTDVDELSDVNNEKCIVLYRVAMELLRNAIFHSGGDKVSLTIKRENGIIQLTVVDNGKGLSLNDDANKHFGLELIKERTYLIGGTFHIDSTEQGTCAQIVLKE